MSYVLENEYLYLECIEAGGEIQHLINKQTQEEIMYQGDQGWVVKIQRCFLWLEILIQDLM